MAQAKLFQGDCLEVLPTLEANSISSIVTDPPYGLSFMGKDWDHGVPGVPFWEAALRVAKPGAHLLAFGGTRTFHRLTCAIEDAGWEIRDCLTWLYGSGFPKGQSQLKPAWEPIIMARKPLIGTMAQNILEHGVGTLNIEDSRIETADNLGDGAYAKNPTTRDNWLTNTRVGDKNSWRRGGAGEYEQPKGRWPANLLLDEEAAAMLDEQSGVSGGGTLQHQSRKRKGFMLSGSENNVQMANAPDNYGDTGGASRFFYVAKASKSDREDGNNHPTVKPTKLMRHLVRLVTPAEGVILDPFMGSGSTGKAAMLEGFNFIGVELEADYIEIAKRRIEHAKNLA
jgi:DNA modification methylase